MRTICYQRHWYIAGPPDEVTGTLCDLVLDIPHLIVSFGVIPPLPVLNEVLSRGGNNGGMSPGTSWEPFKTSIDEYKELVGKLMTLDVQSEKKNHPFIHFETAVLDEKLSHGYETPISDKELADLGYDHLIDDKNIDPIRRFMHWHCLVTRKYRTW